MALSTTGGNSFLGGASAVLGPVLGGGVPVAPIIDGLTSSPSERQKKALSGKYKGVAIYVPVIAAAAKNSSIPASFLFGILAEENGGITKWSTNAVSPAGARGIAQFMPGTWGGQWNKYRNQSPDDPSYAIPAAATYLATLLKQAKGSAYEAAQSYNGGTYRSSETATYGKNVLAYMKAADADSVFATGGTKLQLPGVSSIPGVSEVKDAAKTVADLVQLLLDPRALGEAAAKAIAYVVKFIGKALWDYVIAPLWHWHQRAAVWYMDHNFSPLSQDATPWAGLVTVSFWATGYAVLWAKLDDPRSLTADPRQTALGRTIGAGQNLIARRSITKPSQVSEKTVAKPTPVESRASLTQTNTLAATRARAVKVTGGESQDGTDSTQTAEPGDSRPVRTRSDTGTDDSE